MKEDEFSPALRQGVDFRGTPNATQRVSEHIPPNRERAPLLRYIRINLPRATRLMLLLVIAAVGAASATVALSDYEPFAYAGPLLWAIVAAAVAFVSVGLASHARIWAWGLGIAGVALLAYVGGVLGDAPFVWNGAPIILAATWNLMLLASVVYVLLYGALRYGMLVAAPDDQNFLD